MKKVIKNSAYLFSAQSIVKIISFFYTIFLAKNLGVENYGLFIVALSYFSLATAFADFGINQYIIREVSVNKNKLSLILPNVLVIRLTSLFVFFLVTALLFVLFDSNSLRVELILLGIMAAFPQIAGFTLESVFIAFEKTIFPALGVLLLSLTTTILGVYFISSGYMAEGALSALIIGEILYFLFYLFLLWKRKLFYFKEIDLKSVLSSFKQTIPYGLLTVLGLLYFKVDAIILNYIKGAYETGIYGVAYRFLEAVVFIPSAITLSLFPILSKLSSDNISKVYPLYKKALVLFFIFSIPIVLLYFYLLPVLINLYLPKYSEAIPVIRILSLTIPLIFMISVQGIVLISHKDFLKGLIYMSIFNLVLNIVLNLIFIPQFSYFASAYITIISDIIGFSIFFIFIKNRFKVLK